MIFLLSVACTPQKPPDQLTIHKDTFTFAMSGLYKPFNYKDFKQDGKLSGFDVEIGQALAKEMGLKAQPVTTPWETIIAGLQAQKYDAIIGSMAVTEHRKKAVSFTRPYYRSGAQIFVKEGNQEIRTPDDLRGKKIGVVKASTFIDHAKEYSPHIVEYTSDITALQDLPTGRLDAVITDQVVGLYAMKQMNYPIQDVGSPLTMEEMAIAVNLEDQKLQEQLNQALETLIANGTYERISYKYFNRNILIDGEE
ncbi:amino acid ABC transporter substrate-binding protein (PAAT family) [Hazenella coriacea]|uniref:Amino acid ABC transporter substrate-binding protein (PAAT family) n=1 Tax=Hazenella coriacea TaxID=1179467 RepID=A0A4R3L4I8_9BACL|nr:amino acid ABC transporter substrate-binding protein (PAAT family) [Hazenella coriacea]